MTDSNETIPVEAEIRQSLLTLIDEGCVRENRVSQLTQLANAVWDESSKSSQPGTWQNVNLSEVFKPESTIAIPLSRMRKASHIIEVLAAICVFSPVFFTWRAFSDASYFYASSLNATPTPTATPTPFIQSWATGFDDKQAWINNLHGVSTLNWILILISVTLVALDRAVSIRADASEEKKFNEVSSELAVALGNAQLVINIHDISNPIEGLKSLLDSLKQTIGVVRQLVTVHEQTSAAAGELKSATGELKSATEALNASATKVSENLVEGTTKTLHSFQTGVETLDDRLTTSFENTADTLQQAVKGSLNPLQKATGRLRESAEKLTGASSRIAETSVRSADSQEGIAKTVSDLSKLHEDLIREINLLKITITDLTSKTGNAGNELTSYTIAVQAQLTELQQIAAGIQRIANPQSS
ncbi:MAG: hypothetical protein LBU38_02970 [Propionibacteriaceae bacterium]|jgi:archaellum component FlaC|nr:hypothetical protein [Propionibacteriaceae bacterium]